MALYNIEKKEIKTDLLCLDCPYYDDQAKKCNGIGKACFGYDEITKTCLDPVTGLPFNPNENK